MKFFTGKGKKDASDDDGDPFVDQFFLTKKHYKTLYADAENKSKLTKLEKIAKGIRHDKIFPPPVEQLSPFGLKIMSYLYAVKDGTEGNPDERQPLVASSIEDFKTLVTLIDNAPFDTEVTVILQPMNLQKPMNELSTEEQGWRLKYSPLHKTVFKIRKTESDIVMINLDGTNNPIFRQIAMGWAINALDTNARDKNRESTDVVGVYQINPKEKSRQVDNYACGVLALKDARLANSPDFVNKVRAHAHKLDDTLYAYELLPESFKSIQGSDYRKMALDAHADTVVTRANPLAEEGSRKAKPRTLKETYDHHQDTDGYVHHFSQKYHDQVFEFVKKYRDNVPEINKHIREYDAGQITIEELEARYKLPTMEEKEEAEVTEKMASIEEYYGSDIEDEGTVTVHPTPLFSQFKDLTQDEQTKSEPKSEKLKPKDDTKPGA